METFDKISIPSISNNDMLIILDALQYSYENTNIDEFIELRNNIVDNLLLLSNSNSEDELIEFLKK